MKLDDLFESMEIDSEADRFSHGFDVTPKNTKGHQETIRKKLMDAAKKVELKDVVSIDKTTLELYGYKKWLIDSRKYVPLLAKMINVKPDQISDDSYHSAEEILRYRIEDAERK